MQEILREEEGDADELVAGVKVTLGCARGDLGSREIVWSWVLRDPAHAHQWRRIVRGASSCGRHGLLRSREIAFSGSGHCRRRGSRIGFPVAKARTPRMLQNVAPIRDVYSCGRFAGRLAALEVQERRRCAACVPLYRRKLGSRQG